MAQPIIVAFDLYGTLLSTSSISEELSKLYGREKADQISTQARRYQLEYTWRINCMGAYKTFDDLTRASFHQAAAEAGVQMSTAQEQQIMAAYDGLDTFPEVDAALEKLSQTPSIDAYVFSNGTSTMIASSLKTSSLSKSKTISSEKIITVDDVQAYKPDPRTYLHLLSTVKKGACPEKVWLVSSNPFDAVGAVAIGLRSVWVDRVGLGWIDGLGRALDVKPTTVVKGVDEAVEEIVKMSGTG